MIGFLIFALVLSCAQSQHHWNAQPQQYSARNSASLHQRRLSDPNWAVNSPIQAWEAAYNPLPATAAPQTWSKPQQTWSKPQPNPTKVNKGHYIPWVQPKQATWQQPTYQPQQTYQQPRQQVYAHQPQAVAFTQPQILPGQNPGNVLWAVQKQHQPQTVAFTQPRVLPGQNPGNVLWAVQNLHQQKPSEDPLWALNAHQRAAFVHG